ncbi:MAG: mechanosensitive ion channel [Candidatus Sericytochromatia bacterium]|nr:mechanosensitive ion channel [Candidatus Sericytochromatia bacterium]
MDIINNNLYELISLCLIVLGSALSYFIAKKYVLSAVKKVVNNNQSLWSEIFFEEKIFHYIIYLTPIPIIYLGSFLFPYFQPKIEKVILIYIALIFTFFSEKVLSVLLLIYNGYEISKKRPITTFIQVGKIIIFFIGLVFILSLLFNKSVLTFLSGLGALTAVLMIVFKDSLLSFKAGIQLIYNDMLRIDDWVEIPKFGADGNVIEISLDTIKVKNWDKTITFIPTYKLMEDSFKNWRGMTDTGARRICRSIIIDQYSIRFLNDQDIEKFKKFHLISDYISKKQIEVNEYNSKNMIDTSEIVNGKKLTNIGTFRRYALNYLKSHPDINQDLHLLVRQMSPTPEGIPLEIYAFSNKTKLEVYEEVQSDIFDHFLAIIPEFDLRVYQVLSKI